MGRHKGSGPSIELTGSELAALATDVRRFGNNVVARRAGLSYNGMSLIINGKVKPSVDALEKIRSAIGTLKKIVSGDGYEPSINTGELVESEAMDEELA